MAPTSTLVAVLFAGAAFAFPGMAGGRAGARGVPKERRQASSTSSATTSSSTFPAWHPPQAGEVRSPCPGLNALANHDICPRSGKGYTIPILTSCLATGLNVGPDFALVVGTAGIGSNPNPELLYFDLDMLDHHDVFIEHDASLSRADASTGNDHAFNQTIFNTVLNYFAGDANATIPTASKAKFNRVTTEAARDPSFSYGPVQFVLSYGETALYLSTMGDPTTGSAPLDFVKVLFEDERLPYAEGWRPTAQQTTLSTLGQMIVELNLANGEVVPEGLILGEHSLRAVLIGLNGTTGIVENAALYAVAQLTGAVAALTGGN
ncbi:hypothetical protein MBLNU459_g3331t1 [Dothideomycetes sp. NU459]